MAGSEYLAAVKAACQRELVYPLSEIDAARKAGVEPDELAARNDQLHAEYNDAPEVSPAK